MKVTGNSYQATGHTCFVCDFSPPRAGDIGLVDQANIDADFISVAYNPGRAVRVNAPMLAAADVYRPAAIDQLKVLGDRLKMPVYTEDSADPPGICERAMQEAHRLGRDVVLFDTAGRLAIDEPLMQELEEIKLRTRPALAMAGWVMRTAITSVSSPASARPSIRPAAVPPDPRATNTASGTGHFPCFT